MGIGTNVAQARNHPGNRKSLTRTADSVSSTEGNYFLLKESKPLTWPSDWKVRPVRLDRIFSVCLFYFLFTSESLLTEHWKRMRFTEKMQNCERVKLKKYYEFKENKGCVAPVVNATVFGRLQALVNWKSQHTAELTH